MYRIPGIVSLLQKQKKELSSDDVVTIGSQLWKHRNNPALIKATRPDPKTFENYCDMPENYENQPTTTTDYSSDCESECSDLSGSQSIDIESGIFTQDSNNNDIDSLQQSFENVGFWTSVANKVLNIKTKNYQSDSESEEYSPNQGNSKITVAFN